MERKSNIEDQYQLMETIGSGTYGKVWKAWEKATGKTFAIKYLTNCFEND
jgi:serine/threonine protein kinase